MAVSDEEQRNLAWEKLRKAEQALEACRQALIPNPTRLRQLAKAVEIAREELLDVVSSQWPTE
jgi:hypothetical protein